MALTALAFYAVAALHLQFSKTALCFVQSSDIRFVVNAQGSIVLVQSCVAGVVTAW